jgi:hypothetical protein
MRNAAVLVGSDVSKTHLDRAVRQSVRLQSNDYSQTMPRACSRRSKVL